MTAAQWNAKYPVGQPVIVTLANGKRVPSHTRGLAFRVGQFEMVEVDCIQQGAIPLSWCWAVKGRLEAMDRPPDTKPCRGCGAPFDPRSGSDFCQLCRDEGEAIERGDMDEEWPPSGAMPEG